MRTLPPKPYTQGELIKAMKTVAKFVTDPRLKQKLRDTTGIGTEATRANIINGLIGRGCTVKKGRAVRASDAAFTLIDAVPSAIADPGTTAVWEQALDMIEAGQMALDTFIEKQSVWVGQLVQQYRGATLSLKLPPTPACPQCGAPCSSARARAARSGPARATRTAGARCRSSPRRAGAAHRASGALPPRRPDPRFPCRAGHFTGGKANVPTPRGTQSARLLLQRNGVRRPPSGNGAKVITPRIAPAAIPLIGVPCLGQRLPDALPPREREESLGPRYSVPVPAGETSAPFVCGCTPEVSGPSHETGRVRLLMQRTALTTACADAAHRWFPSSPAEGPRFGAMPCP